MLHVARETLGELVGVEAELRDVVRVRTELTLRVGVDVLRDRLGADVVELVAACRVDRRHRGRRIGHEVGVLHVDDRALGVRGAEGVDAGDRLLEHRRPVLGDVRGGGRRR